MKFQKIFVLISMLFLTAGLFAQVPLDENGRLDYKKMTEADAMRILGDKFAPKFFKTLGDKTEIKESIISGNKITTIVFNYASICAPNRLTQVADLVWNGLGYGFEFGPLAAAEVMSDSGDVLHIVSDSFKDSDFGDSSPDDVKWGWLPKPGYADPDQGEIARLNSPDDNGDGKPDSWPARWYSEGAGKYVWPAFLGDQATAPDEEVYFVVDDYTNAEFNYYPFPSDRSKRGLGLDMQARIIQFNNPLAEDIMFLVYSITNASEKALGEVYFGMHGDPHVGGSADYSDDLAGFVDSEGFTLQPFDFPQRARNMVYAWDKDQTGVSGKKPGYFGWKFLESPSEAEDGIDNDQDGIIDESPFNSAGQYIDGVSIPLETGIADVAAYTAVYGAPKERFEGDEDGDWNPEKDDIGIDGIGPDSPNYPGPDFGEGDGIPSQGWYLDVNGDDIYNTGEPFNEERLDGYKWAGSEPQFGLRDISESDQIGLTSFHAAQYTNGLPNVPLNDPLMWEWLSAGKIDTAGQELLLSAGDNVFNFGTGPTRLAVGETQRFSMCILFGNNIADLILNAETSTKVLEADYRFAQPPTKPKLSVVPGDGKVTLYWDSSSEESVDPLTGEQDFMGYKIYRSRDHAFSDVFTITDGRGNSFLGEAFVNPITGEQAQWHIVIPDEDRSAYANGFHPVEYAGRAAKYYIGDPNDETGLVHEWVDSSVTNGITYYYAVVAFDGGSIEPGSELAPSETQAVILRDPITQELTFDTNTAEVTPGNLASGIVDAEAGTFGIPDVIYGNATGPVQIKILDSRAVPEAHTYAIDFINDTTYSVLDSTGITESFISDDTVFVALSHTNIKENSVTVKTLSGTTVSASDYIVSYEAGKIRGASAGSLPDGAEFSVSYSYYPVWESSRFGNSDANPSFSGMKIYVDNEALGLDLEESSFSDPDIDVNVGLTPASSTQKYPYPADWEIRWKDTESDENGDWTSVGDSVLSTGNQLLTAPFEIYVYELNESRSEIVEKEATYRVAEEPDTRNNGRWDWGERILLQPTGATGAEIAFEVKFVLPSDSVNANPDLPQDGDIYSVKTTRPFQTGDRYEFVTKAAEYKTENAKAELNEIYVVPNPYVAYSESEGPGSTAAKRGERELQFRNLPQTCTIRIYTITGDLVETIHKDDMSSIARWDLLSFEGQRIAYGVYIYHVDVPGVGEQLGRFAVIK